jgi:WD40 repeat protein
MFRWLFVSLLLSACGVAAVWMLVPHLTPAAVSPSDSHPTNARPKRVAPAGVKEPEQAAPRRVTVAMANRTGGQAEVTVFRIDNPQELTAPIVIPDGRLVITEKQVVPAEKDGVIRFIGTEVQTGEVVPPEKQLPDAPLGFLAIQVGSNEQPLNGERFFTLPPDQRIVYRRIRETDEFEPNKIRLSQVLHKVRKLEEGDRVQRGQLLALINPQKQLDEVAGKIAKIDMTEFERLQAEEQETEFKRRYETQKETNRLTPGAIGKDALMETWIQYRKHKAEKDVKKAETKINQRALSAALTELKMHEVRAAIDGVIKVIHKNHQGDAVKQHEPIMEIQNPTRMRVDARLELQEAINLKEGMTAIVEVSRPEAPRVINGHLRAVNCVAVSKGKRPVIVSGSEDETLRGWDSVTGGGLWIVKGQHSAVRSVACTAPSSPHNLACFGCADGSVRVMDLDKPEQNPHEMAERHKGPVLGVAFSPDGTTVATCGDDKQIRLWNTKTGSLLHILGKHSGAVTSVQFASAKRLVSAGKDNRLILWDLEAKPPHPIGRPFDGRGGDVLTLGVSPDGKTVLFDQGKELQLLTLEDRQIVGTLQNPSLGMNFSTMALFSPDGKTILTNGPASGRLQLWRTPAPQMRGSELRSFVWNPPNANGIVTCGAFAPEGGSFAVTGTQDHKVLVWTMPSQQEIDSRLEARLTLVEYNLDTQSRHVKVWAELDNPGWLIQGMQATMVVLPPRK